MDSLDRQKVLRLNSNWGVIGICSYKDALIAMNSGNEFLKAAIAVDVQWNMNDDGTYDFEDLNIPLVPCKWEQWINLPIRDGIDVAINTSKFTIRAPTVLIAVNYEKMPVKKFRPTKSGIWARDKGICQYTGKRLTKGEGNIDHIIPREKGGKDTWENMVLSSKELNSKKGNKFNHEVGLKLQKQPGAPKPIPACATITEARHVDWKPFLMR
jgi:hypothetical protein